MKRESLIELPPLDTVVVLRECYLRICDGNACAAKILACMDYTEDWKPISHERWQRRLLSDHGINAIGTALELLVTKGFFRAAQKSQECFRWHPSVSVPSCGSAASLVPVGGIFYGA